MTEKNKVKVPTLWLWATVISAVLIATFAYFKYRSAFPGGIIKDHALWGQAGDFFGGVLNPAFALLSLTALLYTIHLQRVDLVESRRQLTKAANAQTKSERALSKQVFENAFFQLLEKKTEVLRDVLIDPNIKIWPDSSFTGDTGAKALEAVISMINYQASQDNCNIKTAYEVVYLSYKKNLAHYFRAVYHIFAFIDNSRLKNKDKFEYASIARAYLSVTELVVLFYNGYLGKQSEKMVLLVNKYRLFKHMVKEDLIDMNHIGDKIYDCSAFSSEASS